MKRRDRGSGGIHKRADGTWEGRVELEPGPNGARRRKSVYGKTKAECQQKIKALLQQQEQGMNIDTPRQTVKQFLAYWLEETVKRRRKHNTYLFYEQKTRLYIIPAIGHIHLDKLTPAHVQKMVNDLHDTGLSAQTVLHTLRTLRTALNVAFRQGYIIRNVAQLVDMPTVEKFHASPLSAEQARRLLQQVETDRLKALYYVALFTGMREGELLDLRWADVDLNSAPARIRIKRGKTDSAERTIPLLPRLVVILREHWSWLQEERRLMGVRWKEHGYVFPSIVGTRLGTSSLFKHFKRTLNTAGLPDVRFHDLRHSCASLLAAENVPPYALS